MASTVTVGGASICPSSGARNRGVYFDSQLNLKQHNFQLRQLLVLRRSLPSNILRTLLQAFITCCLDYFNSLPVGLPACNVSRLYSVQNAAGRLFGGVSRYESVEHVLRDKLHWLPIVQRIKFNVRVFRYKAINGLAPPCLKHFFVTVSSISGLSRNRSAARGDFIIPSATKNIFVDEALEWPDLRYGTRFLSKFVAPVPCLCFVRDSIPFYLERLIPSLPLN